jgi:hypothetical protein
MWSDSLADNTEEWGTTVNTVTNYRVPLQVGKFATINFSRRILLHESHQFLVRYCICGLQKSGTGAVVGYSEFIRSSREKQKKNNKSQNEIER